MRHWGFFALAIAVLARPVAAQVAGGFALEVPQVRNYVGLAVGVAPDYSGSNDYTAGIAPAGLLHLGRESERYIKLVATEVAVNLLDHKSWNLGPVLNYRFGRDNVKDKVVDDLQTIDGTVEGGAFISWKVVGEADPRLRFSLSLDVTHDLGGEHDGYLVSVAARYFRPIGRAFTFSAGAATTYASSGFNSTYYGVSARDASSSSLSKFDADAGLRDMRFNVSGILSLSPNWHLGAGVIYQRLLGDAADSPVVEARGSKHQAYAFAGLAYAW